MCCPTEPYILSPRPAIGLDVKDVLLVQASGQNVTRWMQQWTYAPGFPVLNVTLGPDGKAVHVAQARTHSVRLLDCPGTCWHGLLISGLMCLCMRAPLCSPNGDMPAPTCDHLCPLALALS